MLAIQKVTITKLTAILDGTGCKYKIIMPDGDELGTLEVKPVKVGKTRCNLYPRGETRAYYKPFFDKANAQVGDVVTVPYDDRYDPVTLAQNVYSYAHDVWGAGNSTGRRGKTRRIIEVMRLG